ncbi:MAG TPA: type II toxin-antitoxin system VapC family toxin [Dehalococcoidia bacterium]|nr:type II toxin-antitoxin system VapC family toxin [Dehalococcoidia bacterium]
MSEIVVDASVVLKWGLREDYTDQARDLFRDAMAAGVLLLAPRIVRSEVTNAVYKPERRGILTSSQADGLLALLLAIPIELLGPEGLQARAINSPEVDSSEQK